MLACSRLEDLSDQNLDIFEGRIDRISWQTRPDGDRVWEESIQDESRSLGPDNWKNASPLLETEKTMGGRALGRNQEVLFAHLDLKCLLYSCGGQPPREPAVVLTSWIYSFVETPLTLNQGRSVWPIEYYKVDGVWLLGLSHKTSALTSWIVYPGGSQHQCH